MSAQIDHVIVPVVDRDASIAFYETVLGFEHEGEQEPFSVIRVSPTFTMQLAPWGTDGGMHLAFAMTEREFDATFARLRAAGIE